MYIPLLLWPRGDSFLCKLLTTFFHCTLLDETWDWFPGLAQAYWLKTAEMRWGLTHPGDSRENHFTSSNFCWLCQDSWDFDPLILILPFIFILPSHFCLLFFFFPLIDTHVMVFLTIQLPPEPVFWDLLCHLFSVYILYRLFTASDQIQWGWYFWILSVSMTIFLSMDFKSVASHQSSPFRSISQWYGLYVKCHPKPSWDLKVDY